MYRRSGVLEDPWISIEDHNVALNNSTVLYATDAYTVSDPDNSKALWTYGGMDVYIRNRAECTGYVDYHNHSLANSSNFAHVNENNILIFDTN